MTTTRTVTGTWLAPDGVTPQTGTVTFAPSERLKRTAAPWAILPARPLILTLDDAGSISVELPCTGTDEFEPVDGWCWIFTEQLHGAPERRFGFLLPDEPGALDLATLED